MTITIDKEFKELCPPLTAEERNLLEASIEAKGCLDPIDVWNGLIVDGHNRFSACKALRKPFETREQQFADRNEAINWIISKQLGRRNLSDEQKEYLRGKRYRAERNSSPGAPKGNTNAQKINGARNAPLIGKTRTSEKLAKEFGVSESKIKHDNIFSVAVDTLTENLGSDIKQAILSGQSGLSRDQIVKASKLPPDQQLAAVAPKPVTLRSALRKQRAQEKRTAGTNGHASGAISQLATDQVATAKQKKLAELFEAIKRLAATTDSILSRKEEWLAAVDSEHWTAHTKTTIRNKLSGVETDLKQVHRILK